MASTGPGERIGVVPVLIDRVDAAGRLTQCVIAADVDPGKAHGAQVLRIDAFNTEALDNLISLDWRDAIDRISVDDVRAVEAEAGGVDKTWGEDVSVFHNQRQAIANARPGESRIVAGQHVQRLAGEQSRPNGVLLRELVIDAVVVAVPSEKISRVRKQEAEVVGEGSTAEIGSGQELLQDFERCGVQTAGRNHVAGKGRASQWVLDHNGLGNRGQLGEIAGAHLFGGDTGKVESGAGPALSAPGEEKECTVADRRTGDLGVHGVEQILGFRGVEEIAIR